MSNYHRHCEEEMDYETGAVEGLLKLQHHATLKPIHPLQQQQQQQQQHRHPCHHQRLPSLSNLLLPHHYSSSSLSLVEDASSSSSPWASGSNLLYSPNLNHHSDDSSSIYSTQRPSLIPPLSTSTSFSSLKSSASSIKSTGTPKASLLSRAATFTARRRGRPKKSALTAVVDKNEIKIVDMTYNYANESSHHQGSPSCNNKPRWQEAERLELLEAIVKEKELDDMTTIRWDRISLAVGRAKKACKDQWRRELLPNILKGLRSKDK
ncbi:uncharacterized protein EV154DRAFT_604818 [Mucor mucedo]|uniref:uncharacterized protein n=1 Tax=Mucor mucedo TaxID=29922 RepID=UPI00221F099E|nr:uncharacterized protein EV154DRAFT_604818 [Mucor mucedo]KAI7888380.1 hypothetical protein EV154DRAFT_604818 [Mucor mucedo]